MTAIRQLAERLHVNVDQMLAEVLRRFPADAIEIIRAKLELAELDAQSRD